MQIKRLRRRLGFHLLRLLAAHRTRGGMAAIAATGERLGQWHHRLARGQREQLAQQIATAFGLANHDPRPHSWLADAYRLNDRAIFEILGMYSGRLAPAEVAAHAAITGLDQLDQARAEGRGVLLLGWHMGNGVAMATRLAHLGYPVSVVFRESKKIQPDFYRKGLTAMGLNAIGAQPAASGFRGMLKALRSNGILFILMDQGIKHGVDAPFLGKRVPMPPGPAELARRTSCAVVTARLTSVEPVWTFELQREAGLDPAEPVEASIEKLSGIMAARILETPQWWTWHQRRWARYPFTDTTDPNSN